MWSNCNCCEITVGISMNLCMAWRWLKLVLSRIGTLTYRLCLKFETSDCRRCQVAFPVLLKKTAAQKWWRAHRCQPAFFLSSRAVAVISSHNLTREEMLPKAFLTPHCTRAFKIWIVSELVLYIKHGLAKWHIFSMQAFLHCSYDAFKVLPRGLSDPELPYFCKDRYVSYRN